MPALAFVKSTYCRNWGFLSAPPIHKINPPRWACFIFWRMGRDSNPRWSCPHNGFQDRRNRPLCHPSETVFFAGLSNRRFCSLTAPGGAAHHSFALDCADACLADSYARPSQSTALPPILNCFYRRSFKP